MRRVQIDYSNTNIMINNLRSIANSLESEHRQIRSALSELYDLENYYYNKGEIVRELEYREREIYKDIENTEKLIDNITNFSREIKDVDGTLANKFKKDIKKYAKENNIEITSGVDKFLNKVQGALDIVGFIPGIGDIADGINAVISLARGDFGVAFISLVAMIPVIGDAAKGFKYMDKASDLLKLGDKVVDIGKATAKNATKKLGQVAKKETMGIIAKGEKAFKNALEATLDIGKGDTVAWIKNRGEVCFNKVNDMLPENIQVCLNNGCLVGDTLVRTKDGLKEIRDIKVGELVLSKNEELGITEYKKVTELHKNSTYESCIIRTKNSIIEGTTGHLFMIKDKWWTAAIDIASGDFIETAKGIYEETTDIAIIESLYPTNVYNLTVEDNHNYFVSEEEILTHNITTKKNCQKFGEYLKELIGDPPKDMIDPHAHHILFKKGNGKAQQELVKEGQEILKKHGIDPIWGKENLVWAPNRIKGQHNEDSLREIVEALIEVDEFGGEYDEIVNILEKFGRKAAKKGI